MVLVVNALRPPGELRETVLDMERPSPWRFGIFYYDPEDKRIWVPKRIAVLGWTLNFAHPGSWFIFAMIVAVIIGMEVARRSAGVHRGG